ncbi:MAG: hypothetical protein RJB13_1982, partial [Pseudomonadota bacterium]
ESLPTTYVPGQNERSIAVSQSDDFLDGVDVEPQATKANSTMAPPAIPAESIEVLGSNHAQQPLPDTPVVSVSLRNTLNSEPPPTSHLPQVDRRATERQEEPKVVTENLDSSSSARISSHPQESNEKAQKATPTEGAEVKQNSHVLVSSERRSVSTDVELKAKREAIELFEVLLGSAVKGGASDLLLKQGQVPMFRWNGELFPSRNGPRIDGRFFMSLSAALLSESNCNRLNNMTDIDFSYQSLRGGRVRVNIFHQRGELSLVARLIPTEIPTFEKLEMGKNIRNLVEHKRGLILVTGATGSGKSTTLAAMLDFINSTRTSHIITIEDPIEFVHSDKRSLFNQRELGLDTPSYAQALRSALRQAPDVILVGELRDSETVEVALQAAETGHLVLSTLHTNDAADSLLRILGMCGLEKESIVRAQLADSLRGVVSQRLIKRKDKAARVAAQEIMINTANIREKLLKGGHPSLVRDVITQGGHSGMQSFDQHLAQLVGSGVIEYEEALRNATNRDDFALRYSGVGDGREAS